MTISLDEIDRRILAELMRDARQPNTQLANAVGLSPPPCWQRVRRLEKAGIVRGYSARLDMAALGSPETALIEVSLGDHKNYPLEAVCESIAAIPEVLEVHITTGEFDCFVKVAVASNRDLEEFLREKLYKIEGIRSSRSSLSLRCFKSEQSVLP
ncbi:Lrp/AsnC family transcriptional regulator [Salipiger abyssi]|uniref:Transcriptional regulator, AsnC family n=1 Tax=Salipiger abyssi TaxID=1250539 RepID=A0A1P8UP89_9RHOB|nr:Lrp/AsnC family transcriptional regulator [Salipiger abyssi]APZ51168.1 transcriptional regulator, AsnC family [Salipiger abyssi]